jgi:DNA-binding transcriptional MerR regulator/predicted transcriptional regulator YdeE
MIKIGELSKLAQVPVATLRYYDQIGLLKPVEVDRFTGYRYYALSQLPRLHRILALKGLGFSLEQIAAVLAEGLSPDQLRGMLRLRHAQLSQQLAAAQNQLLEVEAHLNQIEREGCLATYDVILKPVERLLVASIRATLPNHSAVGGLFGEVYEALGPHVAEALGPNPEEGGQTLVLCYDTEFKEHDIDAAAAFMLRRSVPERGRMRVHELPAATVAATIHHGSYAMIGAAHEAVITWTVANSYRIVGPDRELNLYHASPVRLDDPSYVTEVQYPVAKADEGTA